ncbi:MAG: LacI family DNA-binding transcriptional regulator [Balneolaceae bacterium]|nr:LacI family DNA-binding transcriptional regulator [Balneolaceae bacterium]
MSSKKKKTTIYDIADKLDITASTVSRALNGNPTISKSTKKLVRETAEKMNYQTNSIAAALRQGKSYTVGIIIPNADRNFFASVIRGIEDVVNKSGYNIIICQSNDSYVKEEANINTLIRAQVDGILASYAKETIEFDHYKEVLEHDIPLVFFDRTNESLNVGSVVIDDFRGAYKATTHLIEQGYKRIVHFAGPKNVSIYKERRRGYVEAIREHGLPVDEKLIMQCGLQIEDGRKLAKKFLQSDELPDAIFSASDFSAVGAMEVFKNEDIAIPEQVAIVGFSNESFTSFVDPGLTTVDQHSIEMGNYAARQFLDIIEGKVSITRSTKTVLDPDLIVRGSSMRRK